MPFKECPKCGYPNFFEININIDFSTGKDKTTGKEDMIICDNCSHIFNPYKREKQRKEVQIKSDQKKKTQEEKTEEKTILELPFTTKVLKKSLNFTSRLGIWQNNFVFWLGILVFFTPIILFPIKWIFKMDLSRLAYIVLIYFTTVTFSMDLILYFLLGLDLMVLGLFRYKNIAFVISGLLFESWIVTTIYWRTLLRFRNYNTGTSIFDAFQFLQNMSKEELYTGIYFIAGSSFTFFIAWYFSKKAVGKLETLSGPITVPFYSENNNEEKERTKDILLSFGLQNLIANAFLIFFFMTMYNKINYEKSNEVTLLFEILWVLIFILWLYKILYIAGEGEFSFKIMKKIANTMGQEEARKNQLEQKKQEVVKQTRKQTVKQKPKVKPEKLMKTTSQNTMNSKNGVTRLLIYMNTQRFVSAFDSEDDAVKTALYAVVKAFELLNIDYKSLPAKIEYIFVDNSGFDLKELSYAATFNWKEYFNEDTPLNDIKILNLQQTVNLPIIAFYVTKKIIIDNSEQKKQNKKKKVNKSDSKKKKVNKGLELASRTITPNVKEEEVDIHGLFTDNTSNDINPEIKRQETTDNENEKEPLSQEKREEKGKDNEEQSETQAIMNEIMDSSVKVPPEITKFGELASEPPELIKRLMQCSKEDVVMEIKRVIEKEKKEQISDYSFSLNKLKFFAYILYKFNEGSYVMSMAIKHPTNDVRYSFLWFLGELILNDVNSDDIVDVLVHARRNDPEYLIKEYVTGVLQRY